MRKIASMFLMLVLVLSCVSANAEYLTVSDAESYAWDKDVDMVVVMVKHNEIREQQDKLAGKVVLDCQNVIKLPNVYHI